MAPDKDESLQRIVRVFEDTIADSAKLREGLTDDEALPLVNWGVAYGKALAHKMAKGSDTPPDDQQVSDQAYNLARLLTRINWVATYRDKKDADWLTQTLLMVNKLSQDLSGPSAPVMAEDKIAAWLPAQAKRPTREVLGDLMTNFTPPTSDEESTTDPESKELGDDLLSVLGAAFSTPSDTSPAEDGGSELLGTVLDMIMGGDSTPSSSGSGSSQDAGSALLGSVIDAMLGGDSTPSSSGSGGSQDAGSALFGSVIDSVLGDGATSSSSQTPSTSIKPPASSSGSGGTSQGTGSGLLGSVIDSVLGDGAASSSSQTPSTSIKPPASSGSGSTSQGTGSGLLGSVIDSVLDGGSSSSQPTSTSIKPPASSSGSGGTSQGTGSGLLGSVIDSVLDDGKPPASSKPDAQDEQKPLGGTGLPGHEKPSQNPLSALFKGRHLPGRGSQKKG